MRQLRRVEHARARAVGPAGDADPDVSGHGASVDRDHCDPWAGSAVSAPVQRALSSVGTLSAGSVRWSATPARGRRVGRVFRTHWFSLLVGLTLAFLVSAELVRRPIVGRGPGLAHAHGRDRLPDRPGCGPADPARGADDRTPHPPRRRRRGGGLSHHAGPGRPQADPAALREDRDPCGGGPDGGLLALGRWRSDLGQRAVLAGAGRCRGGGLCGRRLRRVRAARACARHPRAAAGGHRPVIPTVRPVCVRSGRSISGRP